jgi:hypothetical protein
MRTGWSTLLLVALLTAAGCAEGESADTRTRVAAEAETAWVDETVVRAWQDEHGTEGTWAVAYFLPKEWECYKTQRGELVPRWKLLSRQDGGFSTEELLRKALAALDGAAPDGLSNPLERVRVQLLDAEVLRTTVRLDLGSGIYATNAMGTCGGDAMALQFFATVRHYFPQAERACVLVNGIRSGDDGEALVFHDSIACPVTLADVA